MKTKRQGVAQVAGATSGHDVGDGGTLPQIKIILALFKKYRSGQAPWLMPVIPALWKAEVGRSLGQEFETSVVNMVKPRLY